MYTTENFKCMGKESLLIQLIERESSIYQIIRIATITIYNILDNKNNINAFEVY